MMWPWRRVSRPFEPRRAVSTGVLELETAKEILAEVFHARTDEVEDMIQSRLDEMSRTEQDELWPATFCLGE